MALLRLAFRVSIAATLMSSIWVGADTDGLEPVRDFAEGRRLFRLGLTEVSRI